MWSTTLTRELVGKNYSVYVDNFFSKENFKKMSMWFMWLHHLNHNIFRVQKRVKIPDISVGWLEKYFLQASWPSQILCRLGTSSFPHSRFGKSKSGFAWLAWGREIWFTTDKGATMRSPSSICEWKKPKLLKWFLVVPYVATVWYQQPQMLLSP